MAWAAGVVNPGLPSLYCFDLELTIYLIIPQETT